MNQDKKLETFPASPAFAVVGASSDPNKYGHRCYVCYLQHGLKAYPVNPNESTILGNPVYKSLGVLPEPVQSISIITPARVTENIVEEAITSASRTYGCNLALKADLQLKRLKRQGLNE
jgi:predicted CoA-binding protein